MRTPLAAALTFSSLLIASLPAHACNAGGPVVFAPFGFGAAQWVGLDSYPPCEPPLPPAVRDEVRARDGRGLALAGFYNDPSVALRHRAPLEPAFAPPRPAGDPNVIYSSFGAPPAAPAPKNAVCSAEADKRGLHGEARKEFRAACKANAN